MQQSELLLTTVHMAARADLMNVLVIVTIVIAAVACRVVFCTVHTKGHCTSPVCTGEILADTS